MNDFHRRTADMSEADLQRAYRASSFTAYIAGFAFLLNLTFAVLSAAHGHASLALVLARIGAAAYTGATWFSGAFRAFLLRHRTFDARALDLFRSPLEWFPSPLANIATINGSGHDVQLLPADDRSGK
ncbi:hypothetical protein [Paraburkholderia tropica]|uniref:hypothetical protein n=1 Tax=Paraburkholderia tropica TaxID=92647 RepID=UPI001F26B0C4|nr:hypothetical protein [Paraburkholderia tropica]